MQKKALFKVITGKILLLLYINFFIACSDNQTNEKKNESSRSSNYKNLNVTILLDLSDRISSKLNPEQAEKDIYISFHM